MEEAKFEPMPNGVTKVTVGARSLRIVQVSRIPRSRVHVLCDVLTERGFEVAAGELTTDEAKQFAVDMLRDAIGKPRRLPLPEVTPFSFGMLQTEPDSAWVSDGVILMLRDATRDTPVAKKLLRHMDAEPMADVTNDDLTISRMVASQGRAATAKGKVGGMFYGKRGPVARVHVEGSDTVIRVDARRLALIGHALNGAIYTRPDDPFAPVAFKRGEKTVGLIMPMTVEPSGEELSCGKG